MKLRRRRDPIHSATLFTAITLSLFSVVFLYADIALASRPLWIKPQNVTDPALLVHVNGSYADETGTLTGSMDQYEYLRGRIIPLENLIGDRTDPPARRGEAYIQIHTPDSLWGPSKMYVGVKIPRFWDVTTRTDSGRLDLYFAFDTTDSCAQPDDRIIRLDFSQPDADSLDANGWPVNPVTYSVSEDKGVNPATDCTGAAPLAGATPVLDKYSVNIEDFGDTQHDLFVFAEFEITLPASVYAAQKLKFGLRYDDRDYNSVGQPTQRLMTIPNDPVAQESPATWLTWGFEDTYQIVDLTEPMYTELGISIYNVGQMLNITDLASITSGPDVDLSNVSDLLVNDGGVGDEEQIALAVWSRDIVCLAELMPLSDRQALVKRVNEIRDANDLPAMRAVNITEDKEPNNVILTTWNVDKHETKLFKDLDPGAEGPDDSYLGSTRGAKGVVWARLSPPAKCTYGIDPASGNCRADKVEASTEWLDVFCTHTQAPCSPSGSSECDAEKDHHNNAKRQSQFAALGNYIREKRAIPSLDGTEDGFSRPALVLGDLNQVGPRSMPDANGDPPMGVWLTGFSPKGNTDIKNGGYEPEIAQAYKDMRVKLGNWGQTLYDRNIMGVGNPDRYVQYDISADTGGEGSWIGTEGLGQIGGTKADECTPTFPDMHNNVRVDYVMIIPATVKHPTYSLQFVPGKPARAQVDRHFATFPWEGCLSDHAEVFAHMRLVKAKEPPPPNPNRDNRLRYLISELIDENESDDTLFDDGETDWYTNNFWIKTPNGKCGSTWGKEVTPAGRVANPGWEYSSRPIKKNESATTWLEVSDYDSLSKSDYYDGHSRSPCKHMEFRFEQNTMKVWEEGCGLSLSDDLKEGGYKEVARSMGNGDDGNNDVTVTHKFAVCSISQDPMCSEKCGP